MSRVESYTPGTPSWADLGSPAPDASAAFYGELFGWEATEPGPVEETGGYRMFMLGGQPVAGLGPQMSPGRPYWTTYVTVRDADEAATSVRDAGGTVVVEPMTVLDAGRMAVMMDPEGAAFSVWQPMQHIGSTLVSEPGALAWTELACRRPDDAKRFYGSVFGWTANDIQVGPTAYTEWRIGERPVAGMIEMVGDQWPADLPAHWLVYFAVADADAAVDTVGRLGGQVLVAPRDIPPGRFAVVTDPHGAAFSVIALAPRPS